MAGSAKPELNHSITNTDQLHFAIEFAETCARRMERFQNACFHVIGMQGVEEKQVPHDWILAEFTDDRLTRLSGIKDELHHPLKARAVNLHEKLNQFPSRNF